MKISTKTRYGTRAVVELAQRTGKGPVPTKDIAKNQDISIKYLEQLMTILKSAGIVRSIRGARGGYVLSKLPQQIKLSEIFNALEGPPLPLECLTNNRSCPRTIDCVTKEVWVQVRNAIDNVLDNLTLKDLLERAEKHSSINYQI